jgi:hypothetical protein
VPRTIGTSACRFITSTASGLNRSADPTTAVGQPVSSCSDASHRTSASTWSSGQLACTYTDCVMPPDVASAMYSSIR